MKQAVSNSSKRWLEKSSHLGHMKPTIKILILNLMPNKIDTENQFNRLFEELDYQIDITFLRLESYISKNTPLDYLKTNYGILSDISPTDYDGFICTGSPVETLPFEQVEYWDELTQIFDEIYKAGLPSNFICWGAQAVLYHRYEIKKYLLDKKMFGVFKHTFFNHELIGNIAFPSEVSIPVSRYTGLKKRDVLSVPELKIILDSDEAGVCLVSNTIHNEFYNFNHFEYDTITLSNEYSRDMDKGLNPNIPKYYFPDDNSDMAPSNTWNENALTFFNYWFARIDKGRINQGVNSD